jgi:DNA-binding transcriptional LysR family regulator
MVQLIVAGELQMRERLAAMSVFAQVVEARSFTAAAAKIGISKSLVSREVSALEQSLSVKLLNRTTRRLSLTESGAIFYEHCVRAVQEAQAAERRVTQTQSELAGLVRVTCVQAFALRHLMPALGEFHARYPQIRIKLSCSNRTLDLGMEGFDIGIRISQHPDPNLVARRLAANRKVLCAAPAYLARRGTPSVLEDLAQHDGVLFPGLAPKGAWALRADGRTHAVPVKARLETDDMDAAHAAVVAGLGIGALPLYVAAADLRLGRLVPLLRQFDVLPEADIYLAFLPNRTLPLRVRTLIDFLVQRFEPAPPWEAGW